MELKIEYSRLNIHIIAGFQMFFGAFLGIFLAFVHRGHFIPWSVFLTVASGTLFIFNAYVGIRVIGERRK